MTEERLSKIKDRLIEIIQYEQHRKKKIQQQK